jgi:hypothetical protein
VEGVKHIDEIPIPDLMNRAAFVFRDLYPAAEAKLFF